MIARSLERHGIGNGTGMPRMSLADAEASLINDLEFQEELERQAPISQPDPDLDGYEDAFDALDSGLPVRGNTPPAAGPQHLRAPIPDRYEPIAVGPSPGEWSEEPAPPEPGISLPAAVLVIALCLSVGAATAVLVFHDRVSRISALVTASR